MFQEVKTNDSQANVSVCSMQTCSLESLLVTEQKPHLEKKRGILKQNLEEQYFSGPVFSQMEVWFPQKNEQSFGNRLGSGQKLREKPRTDLKWTLILQKLGFVFFIRALQSCDSWA